MRRVILLALLALAAIPAVAAGHAERATYYPDRNVGAVPEYRTKGPAHVVCKPDSAQRVKQSWAGRGPKRKRMRAKLLRMIKAKCRFQHIQQAVDAAKTGDRILIMPGIYREEPSRAIPVKDPKCSGDEYWEDSGDNHQEDGRVPTYKHQVDCPNARNLIAIIGDSLADEDRTCDQKCNLQIEGLGRYARDVLIEGDRRKEDVLRADRADGIQVLNLTAEQGAYNAIDFVETNGFLIRKVVSRYNQNYGILTFTSDHGLYDNIEAYGNGDSGVYPGSGPEYHCDGYGIEMRYVNSYNNLIGQSGTAGNGTYTHHSRFHHNSAGVSQDSFAPGHPGMPQDCSKWEDNQVYSNNLNLYDMNQELCNDKKTPFAARPKEIVCPQFQAVVGVGYMLYGVNDNLVRDNRIWDQHRNGIRLFGVPAAVRGDNDPAKQYDTSHGNRFMSNTFGVRPDGSKDRNAVDVYWDEQGLRNCWEANDTAPGRPLTSEPAKLPTCASGGSTSMLHNQLKLAQDVPCATWNPQTNPNPPACVWFETPADPGD